MLSLHAQCSAISQSSELGYPAVLSPAWLVQGLGGSPHPPPAAQGQESFDLHRQAGPRSPARCLSPPHPGSAFLGTNWKCGGLS